MRRVLKILLLVFALQASVGLDGDEAESLEEADAAVEESVPVPPPKRNIDIKRERRAFLDEAPSDLTSITLGDKGVSLEVHGFWEPQLTFNFGFANTRFGLQPAVFSGTPFEQKVDLTLALWVFDKWFLEANFQDDNPLNTYRAGYSGQKGDKVEYAGIGNVGLDFPSIPYIDLGGDSKTSIGFYGRFNTGPVQLHTLVRYDAAISGEAVFVGAREQSKYYLNIENTERGRFFTLPDQNIQGVPIVYLETSRGEWREALPSEAVVSAHLGIVELTNTPSMRVAVYYGGGSYTLGSWTTANTFLGEVQDVFDAASFPLDQYAPSSFYVTIDGKRALLLYEKGFFSPFEAQNRYKFASQNVEEAQVVKTENDTIVQGLDLPRVFDTDIFTLQAAGAGAAAQNEKWPLAHLGDAYKALYLGDTSSLPRDMRVRFIAYSTKTGYNLGSDVVPGSVVVFRGGLRDTNFSVNTNTGEVTLHTPAAVNERVRITYMRAAPERRAGSISAGVGFTYDGTDGGKGLEAAAALGLRRNIAEEAFSEYGETNSGRLGFGSRVSWKGETIDAALSLGAGYDESDTTGLYRGGGMEGSELLWRIREGGTSTPGTPSGAEYLPENRTALIYRKYREVDSFGNEALININSNKDIETNLTGPYPALDSALGGEVLVAEVSLSGQDSWAGFEAPIISAIEEASILEAPFRMFRFSNAALGDVEVSLQFVSGSQDLVERKIYPVATDSNGHPLAHNTQDTIIEDPASGAFLYRILLTSEERRRVKGARNVRLVVRNTGGGDVEGRVLIAPIIVRGAKFAPIAIKDMVTQASYTGTVNTVETRDASLRAKFPSDIDKLHPLNAVQRVLQVSWTGLDAGYYAGSDGLLPYMPLEKYRALSFFVKKEGAGVFVFQLGGSRDKLDSYTLRAAIPDGALRPNEWHKVTLYYGLGRRDVLVDGVKIGNGAALTLRDAAADGGSSMTYISFWQETANADGGFSIDEICLEESIPEVWGNMGGRFSYEKRGAILARGGATIVENAMFSLTTEGGVSAAADPKENTPLSRTIGNRAQAQVTLFKINLGGSFNYHIPAAGETVWSGGHFVGRNFWILSLRDDFFIAPSETYWNHNLNASIRGYLPLTLSARLDENAMRLSRSWNAALGFQPFRLFSLSADFNAAWISLTAKLAKEGAYADVWARSLSSMMPDAGIDATERNLRGNFKMSLGTKPVGAAFSFSPSTNANQKSLSSNAVSAADLSLPWSSGLVSGGVTFSRRWNSGIAFYGEDAFSDASFYRASLLRGKDHLLLPPMYSIFADETGVMPAASSSEGDVITESFDDKSAFSFNFPRSTGIPSLFIPSAVNFDFERAVSRRYDTITDTTSFTSSARFFQTALFGAYGAKPVFKFYQSDDFISVISYRLKTPKNETPTWDIMLDNELWFYGFNESRLSFSDNIMFGSVPLQLSFAVNWTLKQKENLPGKLFNYVYSRLRDGLPIGASEIFDNVHPSYLRVFSGKYALQGKITTFSFGYESVVRIMGYMNFSLFSKLDISNDSNAKYTSFTFSGGTKLRLTF